MGSCHCMAESILYQVPYLAIEAGHYSRDMYFVICYGQAQLTDAYKELMEGFFAFQSAVVISSLCNITIIRYCSTDHGAITV